jgi:hypothetical protein
MTSSASYDGTHSMKLSLIVLMKSLDVLFLRCREYPRSSGFGYEGLVPSQSSCVIRDTFSTEVVDAGVPYRSVIGGLHPFEAHGLQRPKTYQGLK